jgi:thymidylate synthase
LKCKTEEEMAMLLKEHPEVEPVVAEYQEISMSEQRRRRAEQREKNRRDAWAALKYARNEGRAELAPVIAEQAQVITEQAQALAEKDQVIAELTRLMQDKGVI